MTLEILKISLTPEAHAIVHATIIQAIIDAERELEEIKERLSYLRYAAKQFNSDNCETINS